MPKFRYINDSVELDFKMSAVMQNTIREAEEADLANDFYTYLMLSNELDLMGKEAFATGRISRKQWDAINQRFPYVNKKKED